MATLTITVPEGYTPDPWLLNASPTEVAAFLDIAARSHHAAETELADHANGSALRAAVSLATQQLHTRIDDERARLVGQQPRQLCRR